MRAFLEVAMSNAVHGAVLAIIVFFVTPCLAKRQRGPFLVGPGARLNSSSHPRPICQFRVLCARPKVLPFRTSGRMRRMTPSVQAFLMRAVERASKTGSTDWRKWCWSWPKR